MRTTGIILLVLGIFSTFGAIVAAYSGHQTSFAGLTFVVLGAFLISRANKKKKEEKEKQQWLEGNKENKY